MKHRHPQSREFRFLFLIAAVVVSLISAFSSCRDQASLPKPAPVQAAAGMARGHVVRVYDGDTVKLSSGERVRFIGIDTPEMHDNPKLYRDVKKTGLDPETIKQMGEKSYEFTKGLLADRDVRLEFDAEARDKYGRLLAYVYLDDGTFVNEEIIKNGYAYPLTIVPNVKHAEDFKALFQEARQKRIGLWADH